MGKAFRGIFEIAYLTMWQAGIRADHGQSALILSSGF